MEVVDVDDTENPQLVGIVLTINELCFIRDLGQLTRGSVDRYYGIDLFNTLIAQFGGKTGKALCNFGLNPLKFTHNDKIVEPVSLSSTETD